MDFKKFTTGEERKYLYIGTAIFCTFVLCIIVFFFIFRFNGVRAAIANVVSILMPFVYGAVFAYLLRPLCNWLKRRILKLFSAIPPSQKADSLAGILSIALSVIIALGAAYLLIFVILSSVMGNIIELTNSIPQKMEQLSAWLISLAGGNVTVENYITSTLASIVSFVEGWLNDNIIPNISNILGGFGSGVMEIASVFMNIIIGIIIAVYLLLGRRRFKTQIKLVLYAIFPERASKAILSEMHYADRVFSGFISGRLLDSVIVGVICYASLLIMGIPNALLVSLIVGVTNIIPFFGPFLGAVPSAIIIVMDDPIKCVWFLIFILVLQQLDGNILDPLIVGDRIGLSSFWVLFAILLFGGLFGFAGMLFGVPVFAVIYDLIRKLLHLGLKHNGQQQMLEQYEDAKKP